MCNKTSYNNVLLIVAVIFLGSKPSVTATPPQSPQSGYKAWPSTV